MEEERSGWLADEALSLSLSLSKHRKPKKLASPQRQSIAEKKQFFPPVAATGHRGGESGDLRNGKFNFLRLLFSPTPLDWAVRASTTHQPHPYCTYPARLYN
jgi:hypothetical protein